MRDNGVSLPFWCYLTVPFTCSAWADGLLLLQRVVVCSVPYPHFQGLPSQATPYLACQQTPDSFRGDEEILCLAYVRGELKSVVGPLLQAGDYSATRTGIETNDRESVATALTTAPPSLPGGISFPSMKSCKAQQDFAYRRRDRNYTHTCP